MVARPHRGHLPRERKTRARRASRVLKKSRVVVVMSKPIHSSIELRQPDGTNVIYLQKGDGFVMLPKDAPTLSKTIRLYPNRENIDLKYPASLIDRTDCEITREDGGAYGATAFIWRNATGKK